MAERRRPDGASSPSGAVASRARRATPRSTATCCEASRSPHPRICLLPTAGGDAEEQIRRFYAAYRHLPCEPIAPVPVSPRRDPVDVRDGPARPGRALRGRRQPVEPARRLARPRRGRDPARGLGARDRAVRHQRGLDVLVRGRRDHLFRRPAAGARAGVAGAAATRCTTTPSRPGDPASTRRSAPSRWRPGRASTTAPDCCSPARELVEAVSARRGAGAYWVEESHGRAVESALQPLPLPERADFEPAVPLAIAEWRETRVRRR